MRQWMRIAVIVVSAGLIFAMVALWLLVDLGTASGVASVAGAGAGLVGLMVTLIGRGSDRPGTTLRASGTGAATATGGAQASTGITARGGAASTEATAENTSNADADGHGSNASTGVTLS